MGVLESRGRFEDATEECERALAMSRELKELDRERGKSWGTWPSCIAFRDAWTRQETCSNGRWKLSLPWSLNPPSRSLPAQRQTEGTLLGELGILHHLRGQFDDAESLYRRALSIFSAIRCLGPVCREDAEGAAVERLRVVELPSEMVEDPELTEQGPSVCR